MARYYDDDRRYRRSYSDRDDGRGFMDRSGDEVRSWFGDEDAERRRRRDEYYDERNDRFRGSRSLPMDRDYDVDRDRRARGGYREDFERDSDRDRMYDRGRGYDRDYERRSSGYDRDRGDYLDDRYDRDYNRRYVRDFGDHNGYRGRFESDREYEMRNREGRGDYDRFDPDRSLYDRGGYTRRPSMEGQHPRTGSGSQIASDRYYRR